MKKMICVLFLLSWVPLVWAQSVQEELNDEAWMLTLDTINAKVHRLMEENTQLMANYNELIQDVTNLTANIDEQSRKNAALADFLKQRQGKSDQQLRLVELQSQVKGAQSQVSEGKKKYEGLKQQVAAIEQSLKRKQASLSDWELRQNAVPVAAPAAPAASGAEDELVGYRKQLEEEKAKEVKLDAELVQYSQASSSKVEIPPPPAVDNLNKKRYQDVLHKKLELEARIRGYEARMEQMKKTMVEDQGWNTQRKKIVHAIVDADKNNEGMRVKMAQLREDIWLLKDKIEKLERQIRYAPKHKEQTGRVRRLN